MKAKGIVLHVILTCIAGLYLLSTSIVSAEKIRVAGDKSYIKPTKEAGILSSVFDFHYHYDQNNELAFRVFETGGGDPAMNGDIIYVAIEQGWDYGAVWRTNINVFSVEKIEWLSRKFKIHAIKDDMAKDGWPLKKKMIYTVSFQWNEKKLDEHELIITKQKIKEWRVK